MRFLEVSLFDFIAVPLKYRLSALILGYLHSQTSRVEITVLWANVIGQLAVQLSPDQVCVITALARAQKRANKRFSVESRRVIGAYQQM